MEKTSWNRRGGAWTACALALSLGLLTVTVSAASAQGERSAVKLAETDAGNLVADAVRELSNSELAFVPASVFKTGSRASTVAAAKALVDPGTDALVVLKLKGTQVKEALERSVSFAGTPFAGFLQVSGLKFQYNPKADIGARVVSITIGGAALEPSRVYTVATTKPLADGQQGYFQIWTKDQSLPTGKTLLDALTAYSAKEPAKLDGRITSLP